MAGVSGATSKPHVSTSSSSASKPSDSKSSQQSASKPDSKPKPKDSFTTTKSAKVDLGHVDASASKSTGPIAQRDDKKDLGSNTTASNHVEVGKGEVGASVSAGADDKGVHANAGAHGELTAVKDEASIKNKTRLLDGEKPVDSENKVDGSVTAQVEGHANADAYADRKGNAGGHVDIGGKAGVEGQVTGSSTLSTTDDKGKKEELASGSVTLHGDAGVAGGFKAGADFKDGKLSTEFGFNVTPGVGGGVDTKLSADFGNIAKEGQKIANETLSGIQRFLGGVHIFG